MRRRRMSHTTMLWSESCVSALGITRVSRTEGQKGRLTNKKKKITNNNHK